LSRRLRAAETRYLGGDWKGFDLHDLREPLSEEGEDIDNGPLDWPSLHFLRGRKRQS
jgi:hypothetical protein